MVEEEEVSWSGEGNGVKTLVIYLVIMGDYGRKLIFHLTLTIHFNLTSNKF